MAATLLTVYRLSVSRDASSAGGRVTGTSAAYLPGGGRTAYPPSKAAVCRYGETLANELAGRLPVFVIGPGLVRTEMTEGAFPDNAACTPPELALELVRRLATGRFDALAGRYLHAEHDDLNVFRRIDERAGVQKSQSERSPRYAAKFHP